MAAVYTVQSYFFNVQAGDGAIHRLFLNGTAISTILMDAGKGGDSRIRPLRNFIVNNHIVFDAVVITHWDSDHYVGLYNLLVEDVGAPLVSLYRCPSLQCPVSRIAC